MGLPTCGELKFQSKPMKQQGFFSKAFVQETNSNGYFDDCNDYSVPKPAGFLEFLTIRGQDPVLVVNNPLKRRRECE
jgi:hypothetical protein